MRMLKFTGGAHVADCLFNVEFKRSMHSVPCSIPNSK